MRMGDELADAMGNADLLGASRTSQQRRNTTYPGPDEDLTAWRTQVEIALRGITDPKTKLTLDHVLSSNPRYITVDAVAPDEGGAAAQGGNVLSRDLDGAITPKKLRFATRLAVGFACSARFFGHICSKTPNMGWIVDWRGWEGPEVPGMEVRFFPMAARSTVRGSQLEED